MSYVQFIFDEFYFVTSKPIKRTKSKPPIQDAHSLGSVISSWLNSENIFYWTINKWEKEKKETHLPDGVVITVFVYVLDFQSCVVSNKLLSYIIIYFFCLNQLKENKIINSETDKNIATQNPKFWLYFSNRIHKLTSLESIRVYLWAQKVTYELQIWEKIYILNSNHHRRQQTTNKHGIYQKNKNKIKIIGRFVN